MTYTTNPVHLFGLQTTRWRGQSELKVAWCLRCQLERGIFNSAQL